MTEMRRTPAEIERDIEQERAELGGTVDELQDRFSPDRIMREIGRGFTDHGKDFGQAISESVKRNPMALALTGIGLAWMMSGRSWEEDKHAVMPKSRRSHAEPRTTDPVDEHRWAAHDALAARRPDGPVPGHPANPEPPGGYGQGEAWLYADDDAYWAGYEDEEDDEGPGLRDRVSEAGAKARDAADRVSEGAHSTASKAGSKASSVRHGVASQAASARHSAAQRARRIRRRLSHGTESLTEEARERVIAARWAAVKARRAAARRARSGADSAAHFFDENPLVVGGLALAAGALLAGALPRTRQEDRYFGEYSDRAYDTAQRTVRAERDKAMRVADRAAQTAQDVLAEERAKIDDQAPGEKSAAEHVADEVREGVSRVADSTKEEAERQKLGKPGS